MKKLQKIELENFQSHKNTVIPFADGVTILTGPTNHGKSSILRALRKILRDLPAGDNFITFGEKGYRIKLYFDDCIVTRQVGKINRYIVEKEGREIQTFDNFGKHIPKEILEVFNILDIIKYRDISFDFHFTDQYKLFLLDDPASVKAKLFGKLTGIDVLDQAQQEANIRIKQQKRNIKTCDTEISDIKEVLIKYECIDKLLQEGTNCQSSQEKIQQLNIEKEFLINHLQNIKRLEGEIVFCKKQLNSFKSLDFVDLLKVDTLLRDYQFLNNIIIQLQKIDKEHTIYKQRYRVLNEELNIKNIESLYEEHTFLIAFLNKIVKMEEAIKNWKKDKEEVNKEQNVFIVESEKILKEAGYCPVCNTKLENKQINYILE